MERKITVITGDRGTGKSQYCLKLYEQAAELGKSCAGIISPAVFENHRKTAFYSMDARSGEQRLCGKITESEGTIGCWAMDPEVIAWSNDCLRTACPCDLLFVDELGPLELVRHEGFTAAIETLRDGLYEHAWVVIRPACIELFRNIFPEFEILWIGDR